MKKLLLLTNLACLCCLMSSCQNTSRQADKNTTENKVVILDSALVKDTTKSEIETTTLPRTVGTTQGIQKDTTKVHSKGTAIIHNAPDQERIDSIKNSKMKNKR